MKRHPCWHCNTPTRRIRHGWFVCSRCRDLTPEERLLSAIFNQPTNAAMQTQRERQEP